MAIYPATATASSSPSPSSSSSCKDRSSEFNAIVERLTRIQQKEKQPPLPLSSASPFRVADGSPPCPSSPSSSDFNKKASKLGLGIHDASKKVARLEKLARRSSMFDDPAKEIQDIIGLLRQDIVRLNSSLKELESMQGLQAEGTNSSTHSFEHSKTVLANLKERFLQTTNDFKEVLTVRTESMKLHDNRKQLFTASTSAENGNPFAQHGPLSTIKGKDAGPRNTPPPWAKNPSDDAAHDISKGVHLRRRAGAGGMPSMQSQVQEQPFVSDHQHERANALRSVESTITELSGMFTQLATMVSQHSELMIRIDDNMDDTLTNVEGAQGALLKYMHKISSNRSLIIKIFLVLIVFLLIFIIFVA